MSKKIIIGLFVLIVLLAMGASYLWSNLGGIIEKAVDTYGTEATQTPVRLGNVKLSLTTGEGSLSDLSMGTPTGFSAPRTLYLGTITVQLDTRSVTGTGPIIIKQVVIDKPEVTYEVNASGDNNLQVIARNAQAYASRFSKDRKPEEKTADQPHADNQGRKIIIETLSITNGQIGISQPLLKGKQLQASLPTIHLNNIGKNEGGATPAEIAQLLIGTITQNASQVATSSLTNALGNIKDLGGNAVKGATGTLGNAGSKIKGLFGQ